jgi:excisionase family DNA binding protein
VIRRKGFSMMADRGEGGGKEQDQRLTYDVEEAGKLLGIGRNQAYEAARSGVIGGVRVVRIGRRMLIPKAPFDRMLAGE